MGTYYIFGKDDLIIREMVEACLKTSEYNHLYADEMSVDEFVGLIASADLFQLEEYHWISNVKALPSGKKQIEAIGAALRRCPPNKHVALTQNINFKDYRDIRKYRSGAIHKLLEDAAGELHDLIRATYPDRVLEWTRARARDYGLVLTSASAGVLAESSAHLPQLIERELEKFSLLKRSDKPQKVPESMIRELVSPVPSERVFEFIDAVLERKGRALHLLKTIIDQGESGTVILRLLFGRFNLLERCLEEGFGVQQEVRGMYPDLRRRFKAQVGGWHRSQVQDAMELAGETDFRLKTSRAGVYDLLAAFTVEVMNL